VCKWTFSYISTGYQIISRHSHINFLYFLANFATISQITSEIMDVSDLRGNGDAYVCVCVSVVCVCVYVRKRERMCVCVSVCEFDDIHYY